MITWHAIALLAAATATPASELPTPEQITHIPPTLQQQLRDYVIKPTHNSEQRLHRLVELVLLPEHLGLEYETSTTRTVAQAYADRKANCLSFTLLFVALAREAGLQAHVQEVGQVVTWYQDQGLIYNAGHVNVGLKLYSRVGTIDMDSNVLYDRRGPRQISDRRALAHFYNNRGAELMALGDNTAARLHYRTALQMDERFAPVWNNLGVLEAREGNVQEAEGDYRAALQLDPSHAPALSNATLLYQRSGDPARAQQLATRLERTQQRDPFFHFMRGAETERSGDYTAAIKHYKRAVRLYDTAHQFHFGLARAYFLSGDHRLAERELNRARELGETDTTRARYQAKLDSLRRLDQRTAHRH